MAGRKLATRIRPGSRLVIAALLGLTMFALPVMGRAGDGSEPHRRARSERELERRLERRMEELERENRKLAEQNRAIQQQLGEQAAEIGALKQQLGASAAPVRTLQEEVPEVKRHVAAIEKRRASVPFTVGFRTGWAELPFDMPGGFFYGAFIEDRLLTQEDGIPFGDVSGELMAGLITGHGAVTPGNLATKLGIVGPVRSNMKVIEIQPTVQYHLHLASIGLYSAKAIRPYVLAGPAIWISQMSTPVYNFGSIPGSRFRHYDAETQAGGVYGLGFSARLGELLWIPAIEGVLNKTSLGAEWRYNQMENGEQFQQYTGSVSFGW